ncbi:S8 family serine peptidase [Kitasatospora sp. NPDC004745]|uniref:S8 family peptidase n=1 Tax=Kitasatospora sp. NPDC004745 TaxID=3364019 RepID=UPI00368162CC
MRVMIEFRLPGEVTRAVLEVPGKQKVKDVVGDLPGVELDPTYPPIALPRPVPLPDGDPLSLRPPLHFSYEPHQATVIVRGQISDDQLAERMAMLSAAHPRIVGVFSDPVIEPFPTCGSDAAVGTWEDVADAICSQDLHADELDGRGVAVAVVDFGVSADHLSRRRPYGDQHQLSLDTDRSWSPPSVHHTPGRTDIPHGTMCAFGALIGAPRAQLLDLALLRSELPTVDALTSDAVAAYDHLHRIMDVLPTEDEHALVISNSWGLYSPRWDLPPGHPGNYTDNLMHPLNRQIAALDDAGADILFAAGNCGTECKHEDCRWETRPIAGGNSHPQVLSVGGVNVHGDRTGYSSQGPGRLVTRKPDLCAYTHFLGSQAKSPDKPDTGTSTACPVAAGVVAALRTRWSPHRLTPERLRRMLQRTAADPTGWGFSEDYGYGVINVPEVLKLLQQH